MSLEKGAKKGRKGTKRDNMKNKRENIIIEGERLREKLGSVWFSYV